MKRGSVGSAPGRRSFALVACALALSADDWPRWGGPARTGVSAETRWRSEGEPLWRAQVGVGNSSLVVQAGRLFTLGYDKATQQDVVSCLDAETGKELWTHRYALLDPLDRDADEQNPGTLTTPAVEGDLVFCTQREGLIRCLRASDGELVWERNGKKELRLDVPLYGFSASPLVIGERVILNLGRVFALDSRTGKTVWRSKKDYGDGYSTPIDLVLGEERFVAVFAGDGLAVLDEENGRPRDFVSWKTRDRVNAMTPVVLGSRVFVSSGYGRGCALIDLSGGSASTSRGTSAGASAPAAAARSRSPADGCCSGPRTARWSSPRRPRTDTTSSPARRCWTAPPGPSARCSWTGGSTCAT